MAVQTLNEVQRDFINDTCRPAIEKLIRIRYYLVGLVDEMSNQQDAITNSADDLGDNADGTAPRTDAPTLTGAQIAALLTFATNMRDQISSTALDTLISVAVRDVPTIIRNGV